MITQKYDFDTPVNRRPMHSSKWNTYDEDVLPMYVADMDFRSPPAVIEALHEMVDHGMFGYVLPPKTLKEAIIKRMKDRYDWDITGDDIVYMPGVIAGVGATARAVAQDGAILMQTPVYYPFRHIPEWSGTARQEAPLTYQPTEKGFTYSFDPETFEAAITPETCMFLLCSPHNPIGRVWRRDELQMMADICLKHDVWICSDEIHSDILLADQRHIPIATLSPEIADRTVTLIAPSKTFNLPGLSFSVSIIQNEELRWKFIRAAAGLITFIYGDQHFSHTNMMGMVAADAAYRFGDDWLEEMLAYLQANRDHARAYIREHMPQLKTAEQEGTILLWIDCREANLGDKPAAWFVKNARVAFNEGAGFGENGVGFVRMNVACPRAQLDDCLERMRTALANRTD